MSGSVDNGSTPVSEQENTMMSINNVSEPTKAGNDSRHRPLNDNAERHERMDGHWQLL